MVMVVMATVATVLMNPTQYNVSHQVQESGVLLVPEVCHQVAPFGVEDADGLRQVVPLHDAALGGVEGGQQGARRQLEGVVGAAVVEVVAQAGHEQGQDLQVAAIVGGGRDREKILDTYLRRNGKKLQPEQLLVRQPEVPDEEEAEVGDREGVRPVVVGGVAVAATDHLESKRGGKGGNAYLGKGRKVPPTRLPPANSHFFFLY